MQKSEAKMIHNFMNKMGTPDQVLIVLGDYSREKGFKGKEPTISKRIRKIFERNGYIVYLIDEYCTSKICNKCHNEVEKFKKKIDKNGEEVLKWGLVRCTNEKCKSIFNRDLNACHNMMNIVEEKFYGFERSAVFKKPDNYVPVCSTANIPKLRSLKK